MSSTSKMPTASKLFAAIVFAGVAYLAADLYALKLTSGRPPGYLREVSALIGLVCGWWIMGPLGGAGRGRIEAMGTGIRTSFTIVVFVLLTFAIHDMLLRSVKGRYDSPMDAVLGIFELCLVLVKPVFSADIIGVLLLGGLIGGAVSHWAGRNFK